MSKWLCGVIFAGACASSPSGATCPTSNAPTWENFGASFVDRYCVGCHSAETGDRHGAPIGQDYDSEDDVMHHAMDIDLETASGPNATNTAMPDLSGPVKLAPTMEERVQLGQFLACEKQKQ
jgi:hypothetical protein